jgi:pimeloyl-ACP methyl ester carboxylesterase
VDSPRLPQLSLHAANGISLAVWHWPGADPPLVFAHATGFHGRLWDAIVRQFPGRRCLAIEARGHGRSAQLAPPYHWPAFGADLAALAESLDLRDSLGIGHSMGGYAVTLAASLRPHTFRAILLVDPTIFPPAQYGFGRPLDTAFTLRRRNHWKSTAEMIDRFHNRAPFAAWKPAILRDYCEHALLPRDGALVLACAPQTEASIYELSIDPEADIHDRLASIAQPTVVLRASVPRVPGVFNLSASPTDPALASLVQRGRDVVLEGHSHFIPMECPERVVEEIRGLDAAGA